MAETRRRVKSGEADVIVSAELCRAHLLRLSWHHVGKDAVAAVTGIDVVRLWQIRTGRMKRVRRSTERRILAVTEAARCDGSLLSAEKTTERIDALRAMGYTLCELGKMLGYKASHSGLQFYGAKRITALNAMRVEKLYNRLLRERAMEEQRKESARVEKLLELAGRVA